MTLFMFYMTGNNLSIFTIMITVAFLFRPLSELFSINKAFVPFEGKGVNLFLPKMLYLLLHLVILGAAIYKFSAMGVLPVNAIDWVYLLEYKEKPSHAVGVFPK